MHTRRRVRGRGGNRRNRVRTRRTVESSENRRNRPIEQVIDGIGHFENDIRQILQVSVGNRTIELNENIETGRVVVEIEDDNGPKTLFFLNPNISVGAVLRYLGFETRDFVLDVSDPYMTATEMLNRPVVSIGLAQGTL